LPEISELSTEQVTEESALINHSKEQNLQPEVKISANETQQDAQKAIVVEHQNHSDCCRCQTGERPVIQKNETTNAVLEEMKQTKKFQTKN